MQLPRSAEYALRALAVIALRQGVVSAEEIADEATVPIHYLHKVLRRLTNAGLLEARKGPGGGFSLARPATRIRIIDVLEATDAQLADDCAFGWGSCDARHPCPLHDTWSELKDSIYAWASKTTLADVHRYASVIPLRRRAR